MSKVKRGNTDLSLLLSVDKPKSLSSHDVVNSIRRIFGERRVGHAGTLDPMATGVLPILIGPATKLSQYFNTCTKQYLAEINFGTSTDTLDAEGCVVEKSTPDPQLKNEDYAREVLSKFIGTISQKPPIYSAIKVHGKKAYEIARGGGVVDLVAREVTIFSADLLEINDACDSIIWRVSFEVSSGTYIRSIVADLSEMVACPAHLCSLERTRVGGITLEDSHSLEELEKVGERASLDPAIALDFGVALLSDKQAHSVRNGLPIRLNSLILSKYDGCDYEPISQSDVESCPILMATPDEILAIYKKDHLVDVLKASSVFHLGVKRGNPTY